MQNVVLSVHLILALLLIGVVLLQRSEGGGLLGGGGVMTNRGATNALQKLTWAIASCSPPWRRSRTLARRGTASITVSE